MKRLYFITSIIVLSCVIASGFIIPITSETNSPKNNTRMVYSAEEYIIKAQGDRIVVYKGKDQKPFIETTTAVSSLPKDVQNKLSRGISYSSEANMREALNEFCS